MKFLLEMQERQRKLFEKGAPLEKLYPVFEANDTFLFTPDHVTRTAPHVRDGLDMKRLMITVVIALIPCVFMAMYNTGLQAHIAIDAGAEPLERWQTAAMEYLGLAFAPDNFLACLVHGALYYLPVLMVTFIFGASCEVLFCIVRGHEVNEGFLVSGMLFPLVLPPTIPLWQVAVGIIFGVIVGKEIFGGTGMNWLNPALTARAFLFFAYPVEISGDRVWTAANTWDNPDAYSGATWLARAFDHGPEAFTGHEEFAGAEEGLAFWDAFLGFIPGSMGETSVLACLLGAGLLIATKIGSWRTMMGAVLGSFVMAGLFNLIAWAVEVDNPFLAVPFWWHWVLGGFAFAVVFMATDPVSSAFTDKGKWIYGGMIGALGMLIRVINPAYAEGWMLAILFMNMFAPLIDYYIKRANIRRRMAFYEA